MAQLPSDKHTIAWFKLAEFVTRKEKERALGIYRLLMHSLQDEAFALQLEGDLLLSFGDDKALEKYDKAAKVYAKMGKYIQAAGIYEHCISLKPELWHYYPEMIKWYFNLGSLHKATLYADIWITLFMQHNQETNLKISLQELFNTEEQLFISERIIFSFIKTGYWNSDFIKDILKQSVGFWRDNDSKKIGIILASLTERPELVEYVNILIHQV